MNNIFADIFVLGVSSERFDLLSCVAEYYNYISAVWWFRGLVIILAYMFTMVFSGKIVAYFVLPPNVAAEKKAAVRGPDEARFDSGVVIGKCENLIIVTLVLLDQVTGLAVIFAAKSIVRQEAVKTNPGYYLGGTLVNLVWSLMVALIVRLLIFGVSVG